MGFRSRRSMWRSSFPSNEAVIAAVATGRYATAVSEAAAPRQMIAAGRLARVPSRCRRAPFACCTTGSAT